MCTGICKAGAHPTSLQKRKMLLSALIPVYNYDCMVFVRSLSRQMQACGVDGEIVVADDGSAAACKAANKDLENVQFCRYIEFEANRGRAAIRNALADMARGEYLLFMDCDAMPPDDLFLSRYADCLSDGSSPDVICGGVTVPDSLPSRDVSLRYYYGLEVERKSASVRLAAPYSSFVPFNFMIRKRTFDRIRFDESFSCYGHEDTFFGFTLQERGVSITHIDNPLVHLGLEPNAVFLAKTRMSVDSLVTHYDKLCPVSRLLRFYCRLCNNGLRFLPYLLYRLCFSAMQQYLIRSACPNLKVFNLYKLAYLSAAMRKTGR